MPTGQILILNREDSGCSNSSCSRLTSILSTFFPSTRAQVISDFEEGRADNPVLVMIHARSGEELVHSVERIQGYVDSPMFAVLCGMAAQEQIPFSLLDALDDYICSPFHSAEFTFRIRRLLAGRLQAQSRDKKLQHEQLRAVVGNSPALCQVLAKIPLIAGCDSTCLLEGETGTGKELFARAIHYMGNRHDKPFVPVNCGAMPDHLIENELFGHAKGAYTDASSAQTGLIACAQEGTLLLDEVDALSLAAQVKLLRLLQEHEYRQVGSSRILESNARIIAASNTDLRRAIAAKRFREDLYHRLNILRLLIPPLRDRVEDIPILATHFLLHHAEKYQKNVRHLSGAALRKLAFYSWPGNVRELEGVIQRAVLMSQGPFIQVGDIDLGDDPFPQKNGEMLPLRAAKAKVMQQFERSYLNEVLTTHCGNVSHAARAAGRERRSFQRLIKKYSIDIRHFRATQNSN